MSRKDFDIIVIGAGAAGLVAARLLGERGRSVCLLEARARVGGRCWSLSGPDAGVPIELGAEFIHGSADATRELLRRSGQLVVDAPEARWYGRGRRLQPAGDAFERMSRAFSRSRALRRDMSFAQFLSHLSARALPADARAMARMMVEGLDAADPQRISAREVVSEWSSDAVAGDQQARPLGGYGPLMQFLADTLDARHVEVRRESVVTAVQWRRGEVVVRGNARGKHFDLRARQAIVTVPLDLLRPGVPGSIRFEPALRAKQRALDLLIMGPVVKLVLQFEAPFWEAIAGGRYREASFFHDGRRRFPTFWTSLPLRTCCLTAWAGGPKARALAGMTREALVETALADLRKLFNSRRVPRRVVASWFHDWQADPFTRGAYSYLAPGGARARRELAEPLEKTLYFAGEAADHQGEAATVAGAIASGQWAAQRMLGEGR